MLIYLPARYCHNAIGGVREWTGVYVFYQIAEQVSWQKGQLLCPYSCSWTNNHAYRVEKVVAPVARKVDNGIHRINRQPVDKC